MFALCGQLLLGIVNLNMKKVTDKQRQMTVRYNFLYRRRTYHVRKTTRKARRSGDNSRISTYLAELADYIDKKIEDGLNISFSGRRDVVVVLPEVLDLCEKYEITTQYFDVIRRLGSAAKYRASRRAVILRSVNFDNIKRISSPAALRLTAELSRWDDNILNLLTPKVGGWNDEILTRFHDLGFFDLFKKSPDLSRVKRQSSVRFVKYIKGNCINKNFSNLKLELSKLVGENIRKWTFLHSGLDEAITNVGHHAYPDDCDVTSKHKNWYLTGAYDEEKRSLKIVFYDQGIGIPRSLPASKVWERALNYISALGVDAAEKRKDEMLLKAAVEVSRTRTNEEDRGKGLADMLEFIKQRGEGYLSIISQHGLYKYTVRNGDGNTKSVRFDNPTMGTLIIWKVQL